MKEKEMEKYMKNKVDLVLKVGSEHGRLGLMDR